ncbi:MAG: thioredoxin family protein [Desulfobulbaceae bacterium]|jgi:thioredoxin 1|nr:thioredoxin family protein [Desulfobulbaceae bacterium]
MKKTALIFAILCLLFVTVPAMAEDTAAKVPVPGMVTMVDLGSHSCIPCKMMEPILDKLRTEYAGRAAIVFIDVWEHKEQAKRFKISTIPTQVFYDAKGQEVYRHQGFMNEEAIIKQLTIMAVPAPTEAK